MNLHTTKKIFKFGFHVAVPTLLSTQLLAAYSPRTVEYENLTTKEERIAYFESSHAANCIDQRLDPEANMLLADILFVESSRHGYFQDISGFLKTAIVATDKPVAGSGPMPLVVPMAPNSRLRAVFLVDQLACKESASAGPVAGARLNEMFRYALTKELAAPTDVNADVACADDLTLH